MLSQKHGMLGNQCVVSGWRETKSTDWIFLSNCGSFHQTNVTIFEVAHKAFCILFFSPQKEVGTFDVNQLNFSSPCDHTVSFVHEWCLFSCVFMCVQLWGTSVMGSVSPTASLLNIRPVITFVYCSLLCFRVYALKGQIWEENIWSESKLTTFSLLWLRLLTSHIL